MTVIIKNIFKYIFGIIVLIFGIILWILPILQGWIFILLGLFILGLKFNGPIMRRFFTFVIGLPKGRNFYKMCWKLNQKFQKKNQI